MASIPTGHLKPAQDSFSKKPINTIVSTNNNADNRLQAPTASTPEQITTALNKSGLNKQNSFNLGDNSRRSKALQTYAETHNQTAQAQLETIITRVDYYA